MWPSRCSGQQSNWISTDSALHRSRGKEPHSFQKEGRFISLETDFLEVIRRKTRYKLGTPIDWWRHLPPPLPPWRPCAGHATGSSSFPRGLGTEYLRFFYRVSLDWFRIPWNRNSFLMSAHGIHSVIPVVFFFF